MFSTCYLCKSKVSKELFSVGHWHVMKCDNCQFVFINPKPTNKYLDRFYKEFKANIFEKNQVSLGDFIRSLRLINKYKGKRKLLLDVGCGNGNFMLLSKCFKWEPVGIDISSPLIEYSVNNKKLNAYQTSIEKFKPKMKFDLITLNQVIEHSNNPMNMIRKSRSLLANDGLLYLATPNFDSIVSKIRKTEFDYLIPPEHLGYFSPTSLRYLLNNNGFKILYLNTWSYPVDLAGLVKYLLGKRSNYKSITNIDNKSNIFKKIKYYIFDRFFSNLFYRLLNFNLNGTMIETLCIKI